MMTGKKNLLILSAVRVFFLASSLPAFAVSVGPGQGLQDNFPGFALSSRSPGFDLKVGRILPGRSRAWGENIGWVDFAPAGGGVEIGANILSGWIETESVGWIWLGDGRPAGGYQYSNRTWRDFGVNNDGEGYLSGWAWSEKAGWISFDGVRIGRDGVFTGWAHSENIGRIGFFGGAKAGCMVRTDPYPWMEIGTGEGIRAGNGFPVGGEAIGIYSGVTKFTVPSLSGLSLLSLGWGEERKEADPVFYLLVEESVFDLREAGKRGFIRGPPEGTTNELTVEFRTGEMLFQRPISRAFFVLDFIIRHSALIRH